MTLPNNLPTLGLDRLRALDRACERALKKEIDRVSKTDVRFARVLKEALTVEAEFERRGALPTTPGG